MGLDRQSIEKRDFPIGRRGYDPAAVDEHLTAIAAEVEELKLSASRRSNGTLASSASEQVRAIVEAAEATAAEIVAQAEAEAREIRTEAAQEAQSARSEATTQARDYVGRVSESTAVMLQRLNAMDSELAALIDGLRTGSNRLNADLQLLETNFDEVTEATGSGVPAPSAPTSVGAEIVVEAEFAPPESASSPEPAASSEQASSPGQEPAPVAPAGDPLDELEEEVAAAPAPQLTPASVTDLSETDELESARLVALNMALNGTSRAETARYLAINFELDDRDRLLDDVYSSVDS